MKRTNLSGSSLGLRLRRPDIKTKILLYDHNPDVTSFPLSILADAEASKYVDGTAFHLYGGDASLMSAVHDAVSE